MLILSRVCADFYDKHRNFLFRISGKDLGLFVDAPESIKQDPLFQMLVDDGSVKFPEDAKSNKALENDPYAGATADGREIGAAGGGNDADFEGSRNKRAVRGTVAPIEAAEQEIKTTKPRTTKSKTTTKTETKPETTADPQADPQTEEKPAAAKTE